MAKITYSTPDNNVCESKPNATAWVIAWDHNKGNYCLIEFDSYEDMINWRGPAHLEVEYSEC